MSRRIRQGKREHEGGTSKRKGVRHEDMRDMSVDESEQTRTTLS